MADKKPLEINPYPEKEAQAPQLDRNAVRDILLSELNNFRGNIRSYWGGLGRSIVGNLFGFFLNRGYGLMFKYTDRDYASIYLDGKSPAGPGNDLGAIQYGTLTSAFTVGSRVTGQTSGATAIIYTDDGTTLQLSFPDGTFVAGEIIKDASSGSATVTVGQAATPSWIFGMAASNKMKIGDDALSSIVRIYGHGATEVGAVNTFPYYGAFDFFCPFRPFEWKTVGGTHDPETIAGYAQEGFIYSRNTAGTRALRIYQNGGWKTVTVT